ncbi:MAG: TolC family protein [Verrucomicrobiota bacterium]
MNVTFSCWFRKPTQTVLRVLLPLLLALSARAQTNGTASLPAEITRPLTLADALNTALQKNAGILKAHNDLEATYGLVVQTRAIAFPKITAVGSYTYTDPSAIENFGTFPQPNQSWNAGLKIVQSIYEGGRVGVAIRAARLTKEQALLQYQSVVSDALLATRIAYYDVLLGAQQIVVNEASVNLLTKELEDQRRRYDAGTVPRFNVLRAEVAAANARPNLIRARNQHRIAKNNLANLLGYDLPRDVWEDLPLNLVDPLAAEPYQVDLPAAIAQALEKRTELGALRKFELLQEENIKNARSGYQPTLQAFAGYGWRNVQFTTPVVLDHAIDGWNAGAQLNWDIFDGLLTKGKVMQAKAQRDKARTDLQDASRQVELQVRTAYSSFVEAKEVLESQQKVQEEAEEALRLARARADAGTGTQLDVLDAETSLTQSRTTQIVALHDYSVARARLERAIGQDIKMEK